MSFQKTRIWHGGLSELGVPGAPARATPQGQVETQHGSAADASAPGGLPFSGAAAAEGLKPARNFAATRFFPIDQLYHAEAAGASAGPAQPGELSEDEVAVLRPRSRRWAKLKAAPPWKLVAYAVLIGAAGTVLAWPAEQAAGRRAPEPNVAPTHEPRALPAQTAPGAEGRAPVREASSAPAGLERSAVDALVAGDAHAAQERYGRLARARPENAAFAEAQRILSGRSSPTSN